MFYINKNTSFTPVDFKTEYPTERELLNGLMDGSVDKIWLFDCGTKEMKKQFSRLTIVDESIEYLSVRVGFAAKKGYEYIEIVYKGELRHGRTEKGQQDRWMITAVTMKTRIGRFVNN